MYAPKEMSHAPHTKNCMKFITARRKWIFIGATLPEIAESEGGLLLVC
jgi:hypothetical protein